MCDAGPQDDSMDDAERVGLTPDSREQMERFRTAHATQVLTILLSDLEGSTRQQSVLGNVQAASLVMAHRTIFRAVLADMDGQEVETAGDSFLVVFAAPSEGVRFALRLQEAMRRGRKGHADLPGVRIGIHQGQVVVERHAAGPKLMDIYGLQVSTAARITDLAGGGQVLCTRAVFDDARAILGADDLAGLRDVTWCNHGSYRFKGVQDTYEVCEVGEASGAPLSAPPATAKSWPAERHTEELGWRPAVGAAVPETNWVLEERLGLVGEGQDAGQYRGAFGEVWKAWNNIDKSRQVFKFCFRHDQLPALKREARLLKRLRKFRHPNLVDVYDVTERDRPPHYLEMEYVQGPSLEEWLATDPPLHDRLDVIAQVADGLATVHAAGIYHRDIKPSNILLTHREDGALRAKLADFGLGAAEDEELLQSIKVSRIEGLSGTWDYIAPEVRGGGTPSARSDLYSLGLTLYQLVAGDVHVPMSADWESRVDSAVLRDDIRRCVAGDPARRWPTADELAQALRSHDERVRTRRLERERAEQLARARRLRVLAGVIGLFALVTFGFGGFATYEWFEARRQRDLAERHRQDALDSARIAQQNAAEAELRKLEAADQRDQTRHQLGMAFLERAGNLRRDGRTVRAFLAAGRAIGFEGCGSALERAFGRLVKPETPAEHRARGMLLTGRFPLLWESPSANDHNAGVSCVAVSPDAKTLASGSWDCDVRLWDLATGRCAVLKGHRAPVFALCFSPDGRTLASASADKTVYLWNTATHRPVGQLAGHAADVLCVVYSGDGRMLVTGSAKGAIRLWSADTRKQIAALDRSGGPVNRVALTADAKTLACAGGEAAVGLWDVGARKRLATLKGHTGSVNYVSFSPDGKRLASAGKDGTVRLWDVARRAATATLDGHAGGVYCVRFSPDGRRLASAGHDRTIRLWHTDRPRLAATLEGHTLPVMSVWFSPDGTALASGGADAAVRLWDASAARETTSPQGHTAAVWSVCFRGDGRQLASGSSDGTVRLWDAATGRQAAVLVGHSERVECVRFSPDGRRLASSGRDHAIVLWDAATGRLAARLDAKKGFRTLFFSPDGKWLASGSHDGEVSLWDVTLRGRLRRHEGHTGVVSSVCFSPDGKSIASAGDDGVVCVWDLLKEGDAPAVRRLEGHTGGVSCVRYNRNGKLLASAGMDGSIRLWTAATGKELAALRGDGGCVFSLDFSPDSEVLASGSVDNAVRLWSIRRGKEIARLEGHTNWVHSVCFDPTGRRIASAGMSGRVRLWDVAAAKGPTELKGDPEMVYQTAFSRDGLLLASAGMDGAVRVWEVATGRPLATLKGHESVVTDVSFSPDGARLASAGWDGTFRLWRLGGEGKYTEVDTPGRKLKTASCVCFNPAGGTLASGHTDGTIRLWETQRYTEPAALAGGKQRVLRILFSPDGRMLAAGHDGGVIRLWNVAERRVVLTTAGSGRSEETRSLGFSGDSALLATAAEAKTLRLWRADTGEAVAVLHGRFGYCRDLSFSPDGRMLALAGSDWKVHLWDVAARKAVATIDHGAGVKCVRFAPTGARLAVGGVKGKVLLWRIAPPLPLPDVLADQFIFNGLEVEFPHRRRNLYRGQSGFRVGPAAASRPATDRAHGRTE